MPAVIGRKGIVKPWPIELDETEKKELEECAKGLREVIAGAEKEVDGDQELKRTLEKNLVADEK
jgi:L-lactate dehydrogenase